MFLVRISIKKRASGRFFCYLLFTIACFLYTLLPSPRDTLELLGQILIKRNIRYWLNTSLFNFDTHKGLTVKIDIILVCTKQQWALQVTSVGFCSKTLFIKNYKKREAVLKDEVGGDEKRFFFFTWPYSNLYLCMPLFSYDNINLCLYFLFPHSCKLCLLTFL